MRNLKAQLVLLSTLAVHANAQPCNPLAERALDGRCNNLIWQKQGSVGDLLLFKAGQYYARGARENLYFLRERPISPGTPNSFPYLPTSNAPAGTCGPPGAALECAYTVYAQKISGYGYASKLDPRALSNNIHSLESPLAPATPQPSEVLTSILWIRTSQLVAHDIQFLEPTITLSRRRQGFPNQSDPQNPTILAGVPILEASDPFNLNPIFNPRGIPEPPRFRAILTDLPSPLLDWVPGHLEPIKFANSATAYLDGDTFYGRTPEVLDQLREHAGGRLRLAPLVSPRVGPIPPLSIPDLPPNLAETGLRNPALVDGTEAFTPSAADPRNLSTVGTVVAQLIWTRLHNVLADGCTQELLGAGLAPHDDAAFACARKRTVAIYQHVIFDEFIPAMTGRRLPTYRGYSPLIDAQSSIESVLGPLSLHSTPGELAPIAKKDGTLDTRLRVELPGQPSPPPGYFPFIGSLFPTPTASAAFYLALAGIPTPQGDPNNPNTPWVLAEDPVAQIARGLAFFPHEANDLTVIDSQRNIPAGYGLDLIANNISRGQHLGAAPYFATRARFVDSSERWIYGRGACPIWALVDDAHDDPLACFELVTGDPARAQLFREQLRLPNNGVKAKVKHIPVFTGIHLEQKLPASLLGITGRALIEDHFQRLRDGDRFYYRNQFSAAEVAWIESFSMAKVIRTALGADVGVQDDAFHVPPPGFFQR